ncbi:hypothetical protein H0H93_012545 [Arthromyces matolae]|nr:hypothetical protein H0H93_012545 [Arthromyces matolae]
MANVVIDDPQISTLLLGGGTWSNATTGRFFGGSAIWPAFAYSDNGDTGDYGTLSFSFNGTSISLFGDTPIAKASQTFMVSIDGHSRYNTSYNDPTPPTSLQWYQSPVLADGTHKINITHIAGASLDYVVVAAGNNTPLLGQTLIVDDSDSSIIYQGSWTRNTGRFISITPTSENYLSGVSELENSLLYTSGTSLNSGDHNLTMEVTGSTNQTSVVLDYILYTPSFATLASKPNLTTTVSSTSIFSGSSTPSSSSNSDTSKSVPIGPIVGSVAGGAMVLALLLLFLLRKRTSSQKLRKSKKPLELKLRPSRDDILAIEPFTTMVPKFAATDDIESSWEEGVPVPSSDPSRPVFSFALEQRKPALPRTTRSTRRQRTSRQVGSNGGILRGRIQRMQELLTQLDREIEMRGEESVEVSVLRERIAELTREDADGGVGVFGVSGNGNRAKPSTTIYAIATAANGETTYAYEEVQSVFLDVAVFGDPAGTGPFVTNLRTYTSDPLTRHATLVEDATHMVIDIVFPTPDPMRGDLALHSDCNFKKNGTGTCVEVAEDRGNTSTGTFTNTFTYQGPLAAIYTITTTEVASRTNKAVLAGSIVGGVAGAIVVIALLLFLLLRKRLFRRKSHKVNRPFVTNLNNRSQHDFSDATDSSRAVIPPTLLEQRKPVLSRTPSTPPQQTARQVGSNAGNLRGRIQHVQELLSQLDREIQEPGEDGVELAALRGRTANLTRDDADGGLGVFDDVRENMLSTRLPPPYESPRL